MRRSVFARSTLTLVISSLFVLFCDHCEASVGNDPDVASEEQAYRTEDIDKTIDNAIKVLTVIREELKEDEKETKAVSTVSPKEESAAVTAGKWIAKVNRM
jgi:hypothetical protein